MDQLVARVRRWTDEGILVFGTRLPTHRKLRDCVTRSSGFDERFEAAFLARFRTAGGIWLPLPDQRYPNYDGEHLHRTGAIKVSKLLAASIRKHLKRSHRAQTR